MYVAHHAALNAPSKDGSTARDSLLVKAAKVLRKFGADSTEYDDAIAKIDGPPVPGALAYLLGWFDEVFGRSGVNEHGVAPLTYATLDAWARLTGRKPKPHEVDALLRLDDVRRHPERMDDG